MFKTNLLLEIKNFIKGLVFETNPLLEMDGFITRLKSWAEAQDLIVSVKEREVQELQAAIELDQVQASKARSYVAKLAI